jgi:hypothetical protein
MHLTKFPSPGKLLFPLYHDGQSAKSALNKAIADAAWYSLRVKTEHQAKKLGNWVVDVALWGSRRGLYPIIQLGFDVNSEKLIQ